MTNRRSMLSAAVWSVCLFLCVTHVATVKVVVIPQNINSHIIYHGRLARTLADEGHTVGFLLQSNAKIPAVIKDSSVQLVRYQVESDVPFTSTESMSQMMVNAALEDSLIKRIQIMAEMKEKMMPHWDRDCEALLSDEEIHNHMTQTEYDIAIVDNAAFKCHIALPYRLKIPVIMYGVLSWEWTFRVPALPSFVPSQLTSFSDQMSFVQRLQNTLVYLFVHVMLVVLNKDIMPHTDPPELVMDVLTKGVFYFALDDLSIAYPRPLMPNTMYIGDLIPQPGESLPYDIATFVDSAEHGVVVVSFGSFFDFIPPNIAEKFCIAFKRIPQKVIWKLNNRDLCDADPGKVLLSNWLPQNDLLSHENIKLFISHCGINSVLESIYHSTPIIGFPLSIDQPFNADRLQHRALGYRMRIKDFTSDELIERISDISHNKTIRENVARASQVMRHKPETPQKRVSYWVQHLVDHGDEHLRTNGFKLNMFQFYCLDVILALLAMIILIVIIIFVCLRCACKCLRYCCCSKKAKLD